MAKSKLEGIWYEASGDVEMVEGDLVCVTGSRNATPYGLAIADMCGRVLAESGITLVTSAARGCSVQAARAALKAGGSVVVVASGRSPWPESSKDVFASADLVLVANDLDLPTRYSFPKRNALLGAVSDVTVMCECSVPSGVVSQADATLAAGHEVWAFPGSVFSPSSQGCNKYIEEGSKMISGEPSLCNALKERFGIDRQKQKVLVRSADPVLSALVASPMSVNEMASRVKAGTIDLLQRLSLHEMNGKVVRLPDGRYSLSRSAYAG